MTGETKTRAKGTGFALAIAAVLAAVAFLLVCWHWEREAKAELKGALETKRVREQALSDLKERDSIFRSKRSEVLEMLRHCEVADDVPKLGGGRIVSVVNNSRQLVLYVPEGKHTLKINFQYDLPSDGGEIKKIAPVWSVPLVGDAGYVLRVGPDAADSSSFWELTCNDAAFETRRERIYERAFSEGNMSWSGHETFDFPNRINSFAKPKFRSALKNPPSIEIYECERRINGVDSRFPITASLRSDNRPCILSRHYPSLAGIGEEDRALPYEGNGVYYLKREQGE